MMILLPKLDTMRSFGPFLEFQKVGGPTHNDALAIGMPNINEQLIPNEIMMILCRQKQNNKKKSRRMYFQSDVNDLIENG